MVDPIAFQSMPDHAEAAPVFVNHLLKDLPLQHPENPPKTGRFPEFNLTYLTVVRQALCRTETQKEPDFSTNGSGLGQMAQGRRQVTVSPEPSTVREGGRPMSERKRRKWTAAEKLRIVLTCMQPGVEVSEVCRREGIKPGVVCSSRSLVSPIDGSSFGPNPARGTSGQIVRAGRETSPLVS
jgi:hypothetical protein